ncbi:helix-turn-helix domain-containing protein [Dellaglioa sp. BT-FLS60]
MIEDYLLQMFQKERRRSNVIYSIIIGRNTVSNIYWGMRYGLLDYFGMAPRFSNERFRVGLSKLQQNHFLEESDGQVWLTVQGVNRQKKLTRELYQIKFPELMSQYKFKEWTETCILAIQVVSELSFANRHYYPIVTSELTKFNIKKWFSKNDKKKLAEQVNSELHLFIQKIDVNAELIFMNKLIGHQLNGLTDQQLAIELELSEIEIQLIYRDTMNFFASWVEQQKQSVFKELVQLVRKTGIISESAKDTMRLVDMGLSIDDIARRRNLKKSTINEHLLELAMLSDVFPFDIFLTKKISDDLTEVMGKNIDRLPFQKIQNQLPDMTFFNYRLYQIYRSKTE